MKRWISLLLAVCMLFTLAACGPKENGNDDQNNNQNDDNQVETTNAYKFGGIGPLTGDAAIYGNAVKNGATIAVDEINAKGGVQINLDFEDDVADGETSVNAYNTLVDWGMQCLVGTVTTGACIAVSAEVYKDRIFTLTPSASSPDVIDGKDNMFQVCFTDPNQGRTAADFIKNNGLAQKVAVIYNNSDDYSTGIYQGFKAQAETVGLEIVSTTTFPDDTTTDFSAQITDAYNNGAEMIFLPIYYTPASNILIQASQKGYDFTYFGCDGLDGILTLEGFDTSLAEGVYVLTPFDTASDAALRFIEKYKAATGSEPNQFAADGYDCMYALYAACQKAGVTADMTADQVCEALIPVFTDPGFSVDGLTGSGMQWGTNGEVSKDPLIVQITNGVYVSQ